MSGKKKKKYIRTQNSAAQRNARSTDNRKADANHAGTAKTVTNNAVLTKTDTKKPVAASRKPSPKKNAPSRKAAPPSPLFDKSNLMEVFARVFLLTMVFIFPIAIGPEKYGNITHYKNSVFYVLAALALCSVIVAMIVKVITTPADQFSVALPKFNLPDMQAVLGLGQLARLDEMNEKRRQIAIEYLEQIKKNLII